MEAGLKKLDGSDTCWTIAERVNEPERTGGAVGVSNFGVVVVPLEAATDLGRRMLMLRSR